MRKGELGRGRLGRERSMKEKGGGERDAGRSGRCKCIEEGREEKGEER